MKSLFFALAFVGAFAQAKTKAPVDICAYMTCGVFEGQFAPAKGEDDVIRITIKSTGDGTGTFDYTRISKDGGEHTWPLTVEFSNEGHGLLRWKGTKVYATTICAHGLCNYALVPFKDEERIWGNVGIMKFTETGLEFMMTVGQPLQSATHTMVMEKK